jgi:predicted DsbA family dithiol-disulfide isomerase
MRPAGDADAASFRVWQTDAGPPSHSIPPHLVAKAAATIGKGAFHAMHERLMHAYFAENRDITDDDTLFALWGEADLPAEAFSRREDPACLRAVVAEHNEAIECGVNGVPAARIEGNDVPFVGAHPIEVYRQWVQRTLDEKRSRT